MKLTQEQNDILFYVDKRPENLLIRAKAGSGKTFIATLSSKLIPKDKAVTFLAFNKHIQEELKTKLPEHIRCYTTYGLGLSALKRKYGEKIQFDEFKIDKIIQKKSKAWDLTHEFDVNEKISQYLSSIKKLVNLCRLTLTLKQDYIGYISDKYDVGLTKSVDFKRALKVLDESTSDRKTYDFIDQIFLPAIDNSIWMFPQDCVYVDECQDISACQLRIVEKILKKDKFTGKITGRLICFGDEFQTIYGFNASDNKVFEKILKIGNFKVLPLSTSFRCSKEVIKKAQEIVPDIKALDNAPEGIVRDGDVLNEANINDFILCRTTVPLVHLFFELLEQNKKVTIKGADIGIGITDMIGKIKTIPNLISFWEGELSKFRNDLKREGIINPEEHSGYSTLQDKVNVLLFMSKQSSSIPDLKNKIQSIFSDEIEGSIVLSTIHKIKGLEANRVFIIRPDLIPLPNVRGWQYEQEKNLEYVAITRAKIELIYDNNWSDEKDN